MKKEEEMTNASPSSSAYGVRNSNGTYTPCQIDTNGVIVRGPLSCPTRHEAIAVARAAIVYARKHERSFMDSVLAVTQ